jgi:hypothetical protein
VVSPNPLALAKRTVRKAWCWAVAPAVILVVLGVIFRHSLNWGDVATWVLAITTLLAFLAAVFAGRVAYDLLKVETARDLKAAEERGLAANDRRRAEDERAAQREADRRSQASNVTAWFDFYSVFGGDTWGATVQNASELPVFDVRVFFFWVNDPGEGRPWTTEQRYASERPFRVIPPGQFRRYDLPSRVREMAKECNDRVYLVGIEFTDANGNHWWRDARAALHDRRSS